MLVRLLPRPKWLLLLVRMRVMACVGIVDGIWKGGLVRGGSCIRDGYYFFGHVGVLFSFVFVCLLDSPGNIELGKWEHGLYGLLTVYTWRFGIISWAYARYGV